MLTGTKLNVQEGKEYIKRHYWIFGLFPLISHPFLHIHTKQTIEQTECLNANAAY